MPILSRQHESLTLSIKIFKTTHRKMKSLQILICSLLQEKHLVITREKDIGVKMFLSYLLQKKCKCQAVYDLNVEAISLAIRRGWRSQLI